MPAMSQVVVDVDDGSAAAHALEWTATGLASLEPLVGMPPIPG